jgi:tetratricopeptide (TPR) repeat protein
VALTYLENALRIEKTLENNKDLADTHLNICAIFSQLGNHVEALEHVLTAIVLLQGDLLYHHAADEASKLEKLSAMVVAYHNLAVEYEHLKRVIWCFRRVLTGLAR